MRQHKDDGTDYGEPPDSWIVTRTWRDVPGTTAVAAIEVSSGMPHEEVTARRADLSPRLYGQVMRTVVLCSFTGQQVELHEPCPYREQQRHPDEECRSAYHRAFQHLEMTPPLSFTREENTALLASVSAVVQELESANIETDLHRYYAVLKSLRTLFAEQGYAFERATE